MYLRNNKTILRSSSLSANDQFESAIVQPKKVIVDRIKNLPNEFDGRKTWGRWINPVIDQGSCGACWACASSAVLSERFNIQTLGKMDVILSATRLAMCNFGGKEFRFIHPGEEKQYNIAFEEDSEFASYTQCDTGNTLFDAFRYLFVIGTSTSQCYSNKLFLESSLPKCNSYGFIDMCEDKITPIRFYRNLHFYAVAGIAKDGGSEENIRNEIYNWGPVASGMNVYEDFYKFDHKSGKIYSWNGKGKSQGGHAIEILGWGDGYWLVKNSWGKTWGDNGYFKIARGKNECGIEENVFGCVPDFFINPKYAKNEDSFTWAEKIKYVLDERKTIDNDLRLMAGGIDKRNGYTRKAITLFPLLDLTPPMNEKNLPNYNNFIAGKISPGWRLNLKVLLIVFLPLLFYSLYMNSRLARRPKENQT